MSDLTLFVVYISKFKEFFYATESTSDLKVFFSFFHRMCKLFITDLERVR